jgi:hypothetical protein
MAEVKINLSLFLTTYINQFSLSLSLSVSHSGYAATLKIKLQIQRNSAVCIATGYRLDYRGVGVRVAVGSRNFTSLSRTEQYPKGTAGPFPAVKWTVRGSDDSIKPMARPRKRGSTYKLPHISSWRGA